MNCPYGSEGHACRARRKAIDHPILMSGPDERVPPEKRNQGHACLARYNIRAVPQLACKRHRVPSPT